MSLIENNMILVKITRQYMRGLYTMDEAITNKGTVIIDMIKNDLRETIFID